MAFGIALLLVPGGALACDGEPCDTRFLFEEAREVRLASGGYLREVSGLTRFAEHLWAVTDKSDAAIYRLDLARREGGVTAAEVPLDIPPPIRQALKACGAHRGDRLDLEDIAVDAEGLFFLLSENYRAILMARVTDPRGGHPRAAAEDVLCLPGRNHTANDGLEGLAAVSGTLYALEEGRGQPTRTFYRCPLPERRCHAVPFPAQTGRTPGLTPRDSDGTRFLVLNMSWELGEGFRRVCEVRTGDPAAGVCVLDLDRVREEVKEQPGGANYEGIHFDRATGRLYVINDNNAAWNRIFTGDAEFEPTLLLIFTLRASGSSP